MQLMQFFQINTKHVAVSLRSVLFVLQLKSSDFDSKSFRKETIDSSFLLPSPEWLLEDSLGLCYFFKASNLSGLRLEAFGVLLSQTLITDSHNSQPVDSHQQTPQGVTYTPFLPLFTIYPSTHLLPLVSKQIDTRRSDSGETRGTRINGDG